MTDSHAENLNAVITCSDKRLKNILEKLEEQLEESIFQIRFWGLPAYYLLHPDRAYEDIEQTIIIANGKPIRLIVDIHEDCRWINDNQQNLCKVFGSDYSKLQTPYSRLHFLFSKLIEIFTEIINNSNYGQKIEVEFRILTLIGTNGDQEFQVALRRTFAFQKGILTLV